MSYLSSLDGYQGPLPAHVEISHRHNLFNGEPVTPEYWPSLPVLTPYNYPEWEALLSQFRTDYVSRVGVMITGNLQVGITFNSGYMTDLYNAENGHSLASYTALPREWCAQVFIGSTALTNSDLEYRLNRVVNVLHKLPSLDELLYQQDIALDALNWYRERFNKSTGIDFDNHTIQGFPFVIGLPGHEYVRGCIDYPLSYWG